MPARAADGQLGAIVLAGGSGRRMGGAVKPLLEVGGRTLLAQAVTALVRFGADPIVVVGPRLADAEVERAPVVWTREDPPGGGPVAGIAAGLAHVDSPWVCVLAGDLVHHARVVERLARHWSDSAAADGIAFRAEGHPQWLAGLYHAASLRSALAAAETHHGAAVRAVLGGLAIDWIVDDDGLTADIDSPDDLARARAELEES